MKTTRLTFSSIGRRTAYRVSLMVGCGDKTAEQPTNSTIRNGSRNPITVTRTKVKAIMVTHTKLKATVTGLARTTARSPTGAAANITSNSPSTTIRKKRPFTFFGSDEKTPEPITAESLLLTIKEPQMQVDLLPVPLDGESGGKSSRFVGTHDGLATVMEYEGTMSAEVDGTPYAGNFKEEAHDHGDE